MEFTSGSSSLTHGKRDVARISDRLCREYGLSVIEERHGWSVPYNVWREKKTASKNTKELVKPKLQLIIDIQNSLKATESIGYRKWAEKFNLEQMSQTLIFIEKEQLDLESLENMAIKNPKALGKIKGEIQSTDEKLQQISLLQRHIGTYSKTKEIYKQYRQSGKSEQFRKENGRSIDGYEAARKYFDEQGYGFGSGNKLPKISELREQYAILSTEKKKLWTKYHELRSKNKEIENAWANVRAILNISDGEKVQVCSVKI